MGSGNKDKRKRGEKPAPKIVPRAQAPQSDDSHLFIEAMRHLKAEDKDEHLFEPRGAKAKAGDAEETLDLHRCTLQEAQDRVEFCVDALLAHGKGPVTLKIITGKGLHSGPGGAVLPSAIHRFVVARFAPSIISIDESPADVMVAGVPIRGHFTVTFRRK